MNSDDLVERTRLACFITSATHPDYTAAVIRFELQEQLQRVFGRAIVNARSGYWLARDQMPAGTFTLLVTAGVLQINPRAYAGKLAKVELSYTNSPSTFFQEIREIAITEVADWVLAQGQTGVPFRYVIENDVIRLVPWPNASVSAARTTFYLRPPALVAPQDGTRALDGTTSTLRGQITALPAPSDFQNITTFSITINAFPFDMTLASPAAPVVANVPVDVIRGGGGWHEVIFRGNMNFNGTTSAALNPAQGTASASLSTPTDDYSKIRVGDFVRIAGQSEWPVLPDEFHGVLADAAAIKILSDLNMGQKAALKASSITPDLNRFQDLITPRTQTSARDIIAPVSLYGTANRSWQVKYP